MLTIEQVKIYAEELAKLDSAEAREDHLRANLILDSEDQRAIAEELAYILRDREAEVVQEAVEESTTAES